MTTVELFKDIGLTKSMKKTMEFTTKEAQTTWFSSKIAKTVTNVAFNKLQNKLKLPMDYGEALAYTYVRFKNLDKSGRIYYYFIDSVALVDDSTVSFQLAIDPIQTFMTEWSLDTCMVNRCHCDRWSSISDYPIRITPNVEGINANYIADIKQDLSETITSYSIPIHCVYFYTSTTHANSPWFELYFAPISESKYHFYSEYEGELSSYETLQFFFTNSVFATFNIDPEKVLAMGILPYMPVNYTYTIDSADPNKIIIKYDTADQVKIISTGSPNGICLAKTNNVTRLDKDITISVKRPTKPSNNALISQYYEPALFMAPYRNRYIYTANNQVNIQLSDIILGQGNNLKISLSVCPSAQQVLFKTGDSDDYISANLEGNLNSALTDSLDIMNNPWLTYMYTQRDSDRQIMNNNMLQNAVNNLIFMGYGGALVGSRGGGLIKENPIYDNIQGLPQSQQPILGYQRGLNPALAGAVGLAAGASIVTSLVDAHMAFQNQRLQERIIQNKAPSIAISGSNAYFNYRKKLNTLYYCETECDDTNLQKAFNNFYMYGYEINEWRVPYIRTRKYFDYILTNGAVVKGAIPQDMKEQIATIFNNGITLFHSDYCTDLEYPAYENIERGLL